MNLTNVSIKQFLVDVSHVTSEMLSVWYGKASV